MKTLIAVGLWLLAGFAAVGIVYRLWRGKPIVLRSQWSPRVVRMVAILLVTLGLAPADTSPSLGAPVDLSKNQNNEELPRTVNPNTLLQWHQRQSARDPWMTFKQSFTQLSLNQGQAAPAQTLERELAVMPPVMRSHFQAELAAIRKQEPIKYAADDLLAVLDAAEQHGYCDHWLNAHLWRKTALLPEKNRAAIFARLHRHARVTDSIIKAFAEVKPTLNISPRAWMSKAGPSAAERQQMQLYQNQLKEVLTVSGKLFGVIDEGTWKRDAVTRFRVSKESAVFELQRGARRQALSAGDEFRFGRLDVLTVPTGDKQSVIEHPWLGTIGLPAGKSISVWDLPALLTNEQRKKIDEEVAAALQGNEDAADRLELALPLVHGAVRVGLKESPQARFAPRLRMLLALFDDAVMPALAEPHNAAADRFDPLRR